MGEQDNRKDPRVSHGFIVQYRLSPGENPWNASPVLDLSVTGCRLKTGTAFSSGQQVELRLRIAGQGQPFNIMGTVMHARKLEGGLFEIGLKFEALDETQLNILKETINFVIKPPGRP